jgi:hypothetical protein
MSPGAVCLAERESCGVGKRRAYASTKRGRSSRRCASVMVNAGRPKNGAYRRPLLPVLIRRQRNDAASLQRGIQRTNAGRRRWKQNTTGSRDPREGLRRNQKRGRSYKAVSPHGTEEQIQNLPIAEMRNEHQYTAPCIM